MFGDPGMPIKAFLARQICQSRGLGDIAVVADHDIHLEIKSAQPNEPDHIIEADRRPARLPPRDRRLRGAGTGSEFLLRQASAPARFADEVATVGTHEANITEVL